MGAGVGGPGSLVRSWNRNESPGDSRGLSHSLASSPEPPPVPRSSGAHSPGAPGKERALDDDGALALPLRDPLSDGSEFSESELSEPELSEECDERSLEESELCDAELAWSPPDLPPSVSGTGASRADAVGEGADAAAGGLGGDPPSRTRVVRVIRHVPELILERSVRSLSSYAAVERRWVDVWDRADDD